MSADQDAGLQDEARRTSEAENENAEDRPKRSLWGLLGVILIIVIIIIVLLMLRSCGNDEGASEGAARTIEAVEGLDPMPGVVSVWIRPGTEIERVCTAAGVEGADCLDMGEGRYVIQIEVGTEDEVVSRIKQLDSAHDAGRVYQDAGSAKGE